MNQKKKLGPNPSGLCICGCGRKTKIATHTEPKRGSVKGFPRKYVPGHNRVKVRCAPPNPSGLCMCGCGQKTPIATRTDAGWGIVKGHPKRFIAGHQVRKSHKTRWGDKTIHERFWTHVNKNGPIPKSCPELGPCWIWTAALDSKGYGRFGEPSTAAHRYSFVVFHHLLFSDKPNVLHKCDNTRCVNPAHLYAGTQADNMRDMTVRGRRHANLEPMQAARRIYDKLPAKKIIARYKAGETTDEIAANFPCSQDVIRRLLKRHGVVMRRAGIRAGNKPSREIIQKRLDGRRRARLLRTSQTTEKPNPQGVHA